jgi:serine/threonine protein phosphatase PrpC
LYTDGLFDVRLSDQAKLNKKKFFTELATQISTDGKPQQSAAIQKTSANAVHDFFGMDRTNRPDDITIVVVERT